MYTHAERETDRTQRSVVPRNIRTHLPGLARVLCVEPLALVAMCVCERVNAALSSTAGSTAFPSSTPDRGSGMQRTMPRAWTFPDAGADSQNVQATSRCAR